MSARIDGTLGVVFPDSSTMGAAPRGYIDGVILSTAGSTATMGISAGQAMDSTNANLMVSSSAYTKLGTAWAVGTGNGGNLEAAAITTSTWYHWWMIKRVDTNPVVVDFGFSTSATAPTMPTGYTLKRRIGSMKTNGSSQWTKFIQDGDLFQWDVQIQDVNANNPGTSAVTRTLSVPTGIRVTPSLSIWAFGGTTEPGAILMSDLSIADTAASGTIGTQYVYQNTGIIVGSVMNTIMTNTSAQVRSRIQTSTAGVTFYVNTMGWTDQRGKNA